MTGFIVMAMALLAAAAVIAYCNPAADRYRARLKHRRYERLIAAGWCHHYAAAVAFGDPPPLTRYACCERSSSPSHDEDRGLTD